MAIFGGLIQTNVGRNLLAKAQIGKVLNFKKIVLGDGQLGSSESISDLTQLKNQVLICNISKIQLKQEGIVSITFNLSNQDIETGFIWREIGIIAQDPDTEAEILYCYGNAGENGEYISAGGETDILEKNVSVDLIVSNVENITATIDKSIVYASQDDIEELITLINTKADKKKTWNITADTMWTGTTAPCTKTIAVQGILATDIPKLYPVYSETFATRIIEKEEYAKISTIKAVANAVELTCDEEKPTVALNLRVEVDY